MAQSLESYREPKLIQPRFQVNPWLVLVVLLLGFFMILLDITIVTVAIPAIEKGLNTTYDRILWVLNGYTLVYAVLLITAARLGDMFGPKRMFLAGLVVFTAASAACFFATSDTELIIFRVIQGLGGALLTPQSLTIITSIFPPEKRGLAFGLWGALAGLASTVGPVLGGWLVTNFDWESIFFINVPIGIATVILVTLLMPEVRSHYRHDLDLRGVLLATAGLFLGIFALIEGQHYSWGPISTVGAFSLGPTRWAPLSIYSLLVYSAVILAIFVWSELRAREPVLPLALFRLTNFSLGSVLFFLLGFAIFPFFTPFTIFMQSILGFSAIHSGLTTVPLSAALIVASPVAGTLANRGLGKWVVMAGALIATGGFMLLVHSLALDNTSWSYAIPLAIAGIGMGFSFAPVTTMAMNAIRPSQAGGASGFLNTVQQAGGTFGQAVVGAVLAQQVANNFAPQAHHYASHLPAAFRGKFVAGWEQAAHSGLRFGADQSFNLPAHLPQAVVAKLIAADRLVFDHAFLAGVQPALYVPAAMLLIAFLVALGFRSNAAPETAIEESTPPVAAAQ
ncbi:MAG TPA: DHA2 family efflux MFS transporter permease subunit [Chloroflexota bacterium]|nr:DHA2 family efflux MFS transporter permease subunit [Chloroflexota bacterium]